MTMKLSLLTREYPPTIYGGAGVHVAQLVPQLRKLIDVEVHCMGEPRDGATAHAEDFPPGANAALRVLGADLSMAAAVGLTIFKSGWPPVTIFIMPTPPLRKEGVGHASPSSS